MSAIPHPGTNAPDSVGRCTAAFEHLRDAFHSAPPPTYATRMARLDALQKWVLTHRNRVAEAIDADFGGRSHYETFLAEILIVNNTLHHTRKHLKRWMRPERRPVYWAFVPSRARVIRQPLGVIGIISPWNYPFQLACLPLIAAIAAGNRVMLKPSEFTPNTSKLVEEMCQAIFPTDEVMVVQGGAELGAAFSSLPFNHLFYTGSTAVGRLVMQAAAKNLTPVTLELGGKSPVLIHPDFDGGKAGIKVAAGKFLNAGQTCLAPDYILLTSNQKDAFVTGVQQAVSKSFPTLLNNPDFTAIINERHQKRLLAHLKDAEEKGAQLITINPGNESTDNLNGKVLPTLVLNPTEEMTLMQEEIFGPILPVRVVDDMNAAVEYVNNRPRPLALYYFDYNTQRANDVLNRTTSGGAVINDVVFHVAQESLPFGGIGESGVGAYHGETGFLTFSHQKSVLYLSRLTTTSLFKPPYGALIDRALSFLLR